MLEKNLSENSIEAYIRDISGLEKSAKNQIPEIFPDTVDLKFLSIYMSELYNTGISARSQARIISGIKAFYKYLILEDLITENPTTLLETPKLAAKLPVVLSVEEIDLLLSAIDLSKPEGHRNKALIETLYSCGLRVSELVNLRISDCHFNDGYIIVTGKGSKQRIVPIGKKAIKEIDYYKKIIDKH